jgi:hypothetical protein
VDKKLTHMVNQLKGKTFPGELYLEFSKYGGVAFDNLYEIASKDDSTGQEKKNTLMVMLYMCKQACQDRFQDLFLLSKDLLLDKNDIVRSSAARVIIGLVRMVDNSSGVYSMSYKRSEIIELLNTSLQQGVDKETEDYMRHYLAQL